MRRLPTLLLVLIVVAVGLVAAGNFDLGPLLITREGEAPADNPFVGREGALPEIWTYGHRNPQGLALDAATGTVCSSDSAPPEWSRSA